MPKLVDLTNKRFNRLVVIKRAGVKKDHIQWLCRCDCGEEKIVNGSSLKSGLTQSCGCLRVIDLTGQKFGRLLVIKGEGTDKWKTAIWLCKCDCGEEKIVKSKNLRYGWTRSCGCLKRPSDLTNRRFDRLLVIKRIESDKWGNAKWLCECDCGNLHEVIGYHLRKGLVKSCGCLNRDYEDITGQRFSKLVAIKRVENNRWLCQCDCGNTCKASISDLKRRDRGCNKGCGCLSKKRSPFESNKLNVYRHYEKSAEQRNHTFDLSLEEFYKITQKKCFYCNIKPSQKSFSKKQKNSKKNPFIYNGIDRVDNDKGYMIDNCVPCCGTCNKMKRKLSKENFLEHIKQIYKHSV